MENHIDPQTMLEFIEGLAAMAVLDKDGNYTYVSPGWERYTGHTAEEAIANAKASQKRLHDMGLEERMKTRIGLLSGGQRQAVTLLMATINVPRVLLLDEHTAALDPVAAQRVLDLTGEIVEKNRITTLMVTHNISTALTMGTRTIMLEGGRIVLDLSGEQREKLDVPGLLALYRETVGAELSNDRMLLTRDDPAKTEK